MPYPPTLWINQVTTLGPTNLNKLENGLHDASVIAEEGVSDAAAAQASATAAEVAAADAQADASAATTAASAASTAASNAQTTANAAVPTATKGASNGVASLDASALIPVVQIPLAALGAVSTALPASPVNGQEAVLVDSLTAPTYAWRFKYFTGISDANKWVFIGGSPLLSTAQGPTITSASYGDLTPLVQLAVPRAGVYRVTYAGFLAVAAGQSGHAAIKKGAAATSDADSLNVGNVTNPMSNMRVQEVTLAAADIVRLQGRASASALTVYGANLGIIPVRVA